MKFKNATKETLRFECGDEEKVTGHSLVFVAGQQTRIAVRKRVPKIINVKPGEIVEIDEGYAMSRGGIADRGSYLFDDLKLRGKLVPIEEHAE